MGTIGRDRRRISIVVGLALDEMISRRAKIRGLTQSRFAAMIAEKWETEGFPAVDEIDRTVRDLVLRQIAAERQAAPAIKTDTVRIRPRKAG